MDVKALEKKMIGLTKYDFKVFTDDELKSVIEELNHLWRKGKKFRELIDASLFEFLSRGHKKAMAYSNEEIIEFLIDSCFSESLKEQVINKKVSQNQAVAILKESLNNGGGTLSDSDGFFVGMKFCTSNGVEVKVDNEVYENPTDNSISTKIKAASNDNYRIINISYSELYKRGLKRLRKSIPTMEIRFIETPIKVYSRELVETEEGQLTLF